MHVILPVWKSILSVVRKAGLGEVVMVPPAIISGAEVVEESVGLAT